jgi:hypothetical protein
VNQPVNGLVRLRGTVAITDIRPAITNPYVARATKTRRSGSLLQEELERLACAQDVRSSQFGGKVRVAIQRSLQDCVVLAPRALDPIRQHELRPQVSCNFVNGLGYDL